MMKRVGFLVNPIAGMGGSVGLKGTDNVVEKALERGAVPVSENRASNALRDMSREDYVLFSCGGSMGEKILKQEGFSYEIIYEPSNPEQTSGEDTIEACRKFLEKKVDLIFFCGGDGTARDIHSVVEDKVPLLGIPSGVKMYSAVFAVNPAAAAELFNDFISDKLEFTEAEIMDVDESKFRDNVLDSKLYGVARVPYKRILIQHFKSVYSSESEDVCKKNIALFAVEFMRDGSLYIVGAGSTTKAIFDVLGLEKTLLGVDAVRDGVLVGSDLTEKQLLDLLADYPKAKIIVSPIGAQGFVFGRGSQQISAAVIRKVGVENIIIIATPLKLSETENLLVDTGDRGLDGKLSGYRRVLCDYRMAQRKHILSV